MNKEIFIDFIHSKIDISFNIIGHKSVKNTFLYLPLSFEVLSE